MCTNITAITHIFCIYIWKSCQFLNYLQSSSKDHWWEEGTVFEFWCSICFTRSLHTWDGKEQSDVKLLTQSQRPPLFRRSCDFPLYEIALPTPNFPANLNNIWYEHIQDIFLQNYTPLSVGSVSCQWTCIKDT